MNAAAEIGKVGERLFAARGDDAVDRLPADAAQRRKRVMDRVAVDVEFDARAVDRGRLDLRPSRSASARNSASLSVLPMSSVIDRGQNSTG